MFSIEFLVEIFSSPWAIPLILSFAIFWLVKQNRRLRAERDALYERLIRWLELRNVELSAEARPDREMGHD